MSEEEFRSILIGEHPDLVRFRRLFRRVPSSPRCKLCSAPFGGAGGAVLRHVGFGRFAGNPAMCTNCVTDFRKSGVMGAEIPITLLFADIRGSTGIGERLPPANSRPSWTASIGSRPTSCWTTMGWSTSSSATR